MKRLFGYITYYKVLWVLALGIILNITYILYLAYYPFKTIEFRNRPFPIANKTIHPGDTLSYVVDYCRYTNVASRFSRTLIGPTLTTLVETTSTTPTGCRISQVSNTVIPSYVTPGEYYLEINACWQVNPLKNVCKTVQTEKFNVIKEKHE